MELGPSVVLIFLCVLSVSKAEEVIHAENLQCIQKCQTDGQAKIAAVKPDLSSLDDVLDSQKRMCEVLKEAKACLFNCENGETAWDAFKSASAGGDGGGPTPAEICGLDSNGNVTSPKLCIRNCQIKSAQRHQQLYGEEPLTAANQSSLTDQLNQTKQACQNYKELKQCLLGCPEGETIWKEFVTETSKPDEGSSGEGSSLVELCGLDKEGGGGISSLFCLQECQVNSVKDIQMGPGKDTKMSLDEAYAKTKKGCQGIKNMKTCILTCPNGQASWDEFVEQSGGGRNSSEGTTALQLCGLVGDSTSIQNLCTATCQYELGKNISSFTKPGADVTPEEAVELAKQGCKSFKRMKTCLLACPNGKQSWDQFVMDTESENEDFGVVKICGLGDNGDSGPGYLCARDCQLNYTTPSKRPTTAASLSEVLSKQQKICEDLEELHTCTINCPNGQNVWNELPKEDIEEILSTCGIGDDDSGAGVLCAQKCQIKSTQLFAQLENEQATTESSLSDLVTKQNKRCGVLKDMHTCTISCPNGQDAWNALPKDDIEEILVQCGVVGDGTGVPLPNLCEVKCEQELNKNLSSLIGSGGDVSIEENVELTKQGCKNYKRMKTCLLACPNGKQSWDKYVMNTESDTVDDFGVVKICGLGDDGDSGAGYLCAQECQWKLMKQFKLPHYEEATTEASLSDLLSKQQKKCGDFKDLHTCTINCPNGKDIWNEMPKEGFQEVQALCGTGSAIGGSSNCPDNDWYPDYCKIAFQQKGQEMCFLEGFKNNCAKTCCSVTVT